LTRHELKEQLQHDQFTDAVSSVVSYAQVNRRLVIRWSVVGVAVLAVAGGIIALLSYQKSERQKDLAAALAVTEAQIGPPNDISRTFPSEDAKYDAEIKALSSVAAKDRGSEEGNVALYYLATLRAKKDQSAKIEGDLRQVAESSSSVAPLAKIALAQLYIGQKKTSEAQDLLRSIVNKPTDLVSKAQAQVLLAQLEASFNPQDSKNTLKMIDAADRKRAAVSRAEEAVSSQLK
jgi:hypothetical protein